MGIEFHQSKDCIFISQSKYANDVLKRFNMVKCKTSPTPSMMGLKLSKEDEGSCVDPTLFKRMVGRIMYLIATSPDIMYRVSLFKGLWSLQKTLIGKMTREY